MDKYQQIHEKLKEKGITFNPPLSLAEVEKFEQLHKISLPAAYRDFLLKVADGGTMIDDFPLMPLYQCKTDDSLIHKDFPLTDYWIWEDDEDADPDKINEVDFGNLTLIDIGDGQTWNLILSGSCAGEMWFFTDVGVQPACPRRDFLSWFEYWLDGGDDYFSDFAY